MKKIINAYRLIKRIPNALSILFLVLLAGLAEGIGISALVPVLSIMTGEFAGDKLPTPFNILPDGMELIGITPSFSAMLFFTLVIMLGAYLLVYLQERAVFSARYKYLEKVRDRANSAIFKSRWENISGLSSGSVTNITIHESERGAEGLLALMSMLAISVQLLVYGIFAFILSWKMFLVALISILLAAFAARRLIRAVRALGKTSVDIDALYSSQFVEFVRGAKLLKATAVIPDVLSTLHDSNVGACDAKRRIVISQSLMKFELQVIVSIALVTILYFAIETFQVQVSVLLVFMFIVMRLAPRFTSLQGQYHNYTAYRPALDKIDSMISDSENMAEDEQHNCYDFLDIDESIRLDNVSYVYPGAKSYAINNISLTIKPREFVALVGKSGSGKSTALDILMALIEPTDGQILIDGHDKSICREQYRRRIGFVSQDSIFFVGTLRENLCLGLAADIYDEKYLWECLEIAQIDDFVKSLPALLETKVGEAGINLSGGQRQRLAIARALIRRPAILVLDEATSALDSESEARFQMAIQAVTMNYTTIVVAHRISTIKNADTIYVFKDGGLVQRGNYNKLVSEPGIFLELVQAQMTGLN